MSDNSMTTIGIDLGDRYSHLCGLTEEGEIAEEGRFRMQKEAIQSVFGGRTPSRIVMEAGSQSAWVSDLLGSLGHEVIVANSRQIYLISKSANKNDRSDAEMLARLGRSDLELLRPIKHRSAETLADREMLRARSLLVATRTRLINHARSAAKGVGVRLPSTATSTFVNKVTDVIPERLREALNPILKLIGEVNEAIHNFDRDLAAMAKSKYPETDMLRQITGVGVITSLTFMLVLEDPNRFPTSRAVGSYVGLRPRQHQSGEMDRQMRITKAGDSELRRVLVQSAHYIMGPFGPDTDLRRFGERLSARGGKAAKKRAVIAVARKLAILLHHLWLTGEEYEALYQANAT